MSDIITLDVRDARRAVEKQLRGLNDGIRNKASAMALNKTITKGRTEMSRAIRAEFNLLSAEVLPRLRVIRARRNASHLVAILDPFASTSKRGRSLNVIRFLESKVTLAEMKRRRKSGSHKQLRFNIRRGAGTKTIKGSFIGNKGRTVFIREGKGRTPIKAVSTIDVPQMFNTRRINRRVVERILKEFPVEFERAARLELARFNR